jgi:peroxiredoxin
MVETASTMLPLGTPAPAFSLKDTEGNTVSLEDFKGAPALLVIFMCNHCPFVKHVLDEMVELVKQYQDKGVAAVGINSNDVANYPQDSPEKMAEAVQEKGFTFSYLYDETQDAAKAYRAACTPDFFIFDKDQRLVYRGQMDPSRPGNSLPVNGEDLRAALDSLLQGQEVITRQIPSIGCNIKWKKGNAPDYFGA